MNADQHDELLIACELFGANSFCYRAARQSSAELLRARVHYVQSVLDLVLNQVFSAISPKPAFFSRGSGRFIVLIPAAGIDLQKIEKRIGELNQRLLKMHRGALQLIFTCERVAAPNGSKNNLRPPLRNSSNSGAESAKNHYASAFASLASKLREKELEPFKSNLRDLFSIAPQAGVDETGSEAPPGPTAHGLRRENSTTNDPPASASSRLIPADTAFAAPAFSPAAAHGLAGECHYCGRDDLPAAELTFQSESGRGCTFCRAILHFSAGNDKQNSDQVKAEFPPPLEQRAELPREILSAACLLKKAGAICPRAEQNYESALHTEFRTVTGIPPFFPDEREPAYSGAAGTALIDLLERELNTALSHNIRSGDAEHPPFIVELGSDNLILLGKLQTLIDLSFALSKALESSHPQVCHSTGIVHSSRPLPLNWLIRDAVRLSERGRQESEKFMSVGFSGPAEIAGFSWSDWRGQIKPILERIRHFDQLGALGFGFWDYLLNFTRSASTSIYPIMYRIARREESHAVLRKDPDWTQFKADILLALSGGSAEASQRRSILRTALCWYLFSRKTADPVLQERETTLIERG